MKTVAFKTLGCKLNQFETSAVREMFEAARFLSVPFTEKADVYVINTCTVTSRSDFKSRKEIRRALRKNPEALIVATGCYAQVSPDEIAKIPGVDLIVGNEEKGKIVSLLPKEKVSPPMIAVGPISDSTRYQDLCVFDFKDSTRAFVKVQDGCSFCCSYCRVPQARGRSRSKPLEEVIRQVKTLSVLGYKEIVLTGVNLGMYGVDLQGDLSLKRLLEEILKRVPSIGRLRISSIEPCEINKGLLELFSQHKALCRHLHVPLQSGCDRVLARMRRRYTISQYKEILDMITEMLPDASIGTDVLVGFPGEDEDGFRETLDFLREAPFSYLHVFEFSPRRNTPAFFFDQKVPPQTIHKRSTVLRDLSGKKAFLFRNRFLNKELEVIILKKRDCETGDLVGLTGNYIKVLFAGDDSLMNQIRRVKITQVSPDKTFGVLV
jgi:threonylcarbamoyladenosine tRNA methylthiotransferase MtaB